MWQVLLAAAVAGSGIVARNIFNKDLDSTLETASDHDQDQDHDHTHSDFSNFALKPSDHHLMESPKPNVPSSSTPFTPNSCSVKGVIHEEQEDGGIFRFSSSGSGNGSGSRSISKSSRTKKKFWIKRRKSNANVNGLRRGVEVQKAEKKITVCLKKRRTTTIASVKCGSRSSKDSSVFDWGVGVGMMYMMSAGKAEISKLYAAMDETAKVVHELKVELHKRKSSRNVQVSRSVSQAKTTPKKFKSKLSQPVFSSSISEDEDLNDINVLGLPVAEHGEYASSVLTEEPGTQVQEMDQLEAEFESELQKLSCSKEASRPAGITSYFCEETEVSDKVFREHEEQSSSSPQCHGVLPFELDRKLSQLLIGQQESQIVELETELHTAHSKLNEKEAELQALKDCVKRLTAFSLSAVSDDEHEVHMEEDKMMAAESKQPVVGMKRAIDS